LPRGGHRVRQGRDMVRELLLERLLPQAGEAPPGGILRGAGRLRPGLARTGATGLRPLEGTARSLQGAPPPPRPSYPRLGHAAPAEPRQVLPRRVSLWRRDPQRQAVGAAPEVYLDQRGAGDRPALPAPPFWDRGFLRSVHHYFQAEVR